MRNLFTLALFVAFLFGFGLAVPAEAAGHHPCWAAADPGICAVWTADVRGERYSGSFEDLTQPRLLTRADLEREVRLEAAYAYHARHMTEHPSEYRTGVSGPDGFDLGIQSVSPADVRIVNLSP
jgi:hypothetical protein